MRKPKTWTEPPVRLVRRRDRDTYTVPSSRPGIGLYLIDLGNRHFPKGRCSCDDFDKRIEPAILNGHTPPRCTCVHIDAVQAVLQHAQILCELAGLQFHQRLIPA